MMNNLEGDESQPSVAEYETRQVTCDMQCLAADVTRLQQELDDQRRRQRRQQELLDQQQLKLYQLAEAH